MDVVDFSDHMCTIRAAPVQRPYICEQVGGDRLLVEGNEQDPSCGGQLRNEDSE